MKLETELMRGAGPLAILQLLSRGEMYGYQLAQEISTTSEGILEMGHSTLYPMLYNLEAKGWVRSRLEETDAGRRRKYYSLTSKGCTVLSRQKAQWGELVRAMARVGVPEDTGA